MQHLSIDRRKGLLHAMVEGATTQEDFNRLSEAEQDWLLMLPLRPKGEWSKFFNGTRAQLERLIVNSVKS